MVVPGVAAVILACSGDPTDNTRTPTAIVANPEIVFVNQADSQAVLLNVVDEDGQNLPATFTVSDKPAGFIVSDPDPNFLPVNSSNPIGVTTRIFVKATDLASGSFTVSALGLTKSIAVSSTPQSAAVTFSNATPAPGEIVTITAPAGLLFKPTSAVLAGVTSLVVTARAADGTSISFIPSPNIAGPVNITHVTTTYNPALDFTLPTSTPLTSVVLANVAGAFDNSAPPLNTLVTYTLPADVRLLPQFKDSMKVEGTATRPAQITISADSGTLTFFPPPSSDSTLSFQGIVQRATPQYPLALRSSTKITTPRIDTLDVTISPTQSPAIAEAITVGAPAGFTFTAGTSITDAAGSKISFAGANAIITARTATSMTIIPLPGAVGVGTVTAVNAAAAPQFKLTLPTKLGITVPELVPLRFTDIPSAAPTLTMPTAGNSLTLNDAGTFLGPADCCFGGHTRLYKFTLSATTTLTGTLDWFPGAEDLGLYWTAADAITPVGNFDGDGQGPGGKPETSTVTLAAGTYYIAIANFGTAAGASDPTFFQIKISNP
jgi:hypothetical protein